MPPQGPANPLGSLGSSLEGFRAKIRIEPTQEVVAPTGARAKSLAETYFSMYVASLTARVEAWVAPGDRAAQATHGSKA